MAISRKRQKRRSLPAARKKPPAKRSPPRRQAPAGKPARTAPARADFGAPIDGFFRKQPPRLRAILEELRTLVEDAAPGAESSLKWGMPFFSLDGAMVCALGAHAAHVNLILPGPPGTYPDPGGRLAGEGKTGRHLKLTSVAELPRAEVRGWLRTAAKLAREQR